MMIAALPLVASAITAVGHSAPASSVAGSLASTSATSSAASSVGDSFSSMLGSFAKDTIGKMQNSEQMSVAGIEGKATTQSVVEAVMSAQEQLQTALAVRDKAVSAFQDVSRMAI